MRALGWLLIVLGAVSARADDGALLRNRYLDKMFAVYGVGAYSLGSDASLVNASARPYRRYAGAVGLSFGTQWLLTSFGAFAGFEAEVEAGAATGNFHADGVTRFNWPKPDATDNPDFGLSLKANGHLVVSPIWFRFGDDSGLRLGLMAGLAFDWLATEAWNQVGTMDVGAQLSLRLGGFGLTATGLYTPPQGNDWNLARLTGSLTLCLGQFVLGGRYVLSNGRPNVATDTRPLGLVAEQTFSVIIGGAFGE